MAKSVNHCTATQDPLSRFQNISIGEASTLSGEALSHRPFVSASQAGLLQCYIQRRSGSNGESLHDRGCL